MTIPLVNQIQFAEYRRDHLDRATDPRFVPAGHLPLRTLGARLIRSGARRGLRLADRLEGHYQPA